jgi:predicted alpha/beta-hydrolase family hydrolase
MASHTAPGELLTLTVAAGVEVTGRWLAPADARACYVLAHGAGAGMEHPFMRATAVQLATLGIATLRYQFPYLQRGSKRPDPPAVCHATVRAAVAEAQRRAPATALFAGGRSFGGRMSSQAQALEPLPRVRGLVFLGFPLHPAGRPGRERAAHLAGISIPMLFIQGDRDALAEAPLLEQVLAPLAPRARAHWIPQADHAFHLPARSGRNDGQVLHELLGAAADWMIEHS